MSSIRKYATFKLNRQLFGIDILMIREINRQLDITPAPHAAEYIRGLINLRGQIVTIIDLKSSLGIGKFDITENSHNIILKTDAELSTVRKFEDRDDLYSVADKVGLLVDEIGDVVTVNVEDIDVPPANIGELDGKYLCGVIKLDKTLMAILSARKILG